MKFTFVILNYNSTIETIKCIDSIMRLSYEDKNIVIVDNNSPDQREFLNKICDKYSNLKNINLLIADENFGYARGNNIGINFSKDQLKSDFVCVLNPDVEIKSSNFIEKAIEKYEEYNYAVAGPRIVTNKIDINPGFGYSESLIRAVKNLIFGNYRILLIKKLKLYKINPFKKHKKLEADFNNAFVKQKKGMNKDIKISLESGTWLSGSCFIFSPTFFSSYGGFCDKTFLYCEEAILECCLLHNNETMMFLSDLLVKHEGGKSSEHEVADSDEREIFKHTVGAQSSSVFIKVLLHKNNSEYLKECLTPKIASYKKIF